MLPRYIRPEEIVPGDVIRVRFPEDRGCTTLKEGRVATVKANGADRNVITAEGAVLLVWTPYTSRYAKPRVTLLSAGAPVQDELDLQL